MDRRPDRDYERDPRPYEAGRGRGGDYGRLAGGTEWDRPIDQRSYDRGPRYDRGGYRRGRGTEFSYEETYRPDRSFEVDRGDRGRRSEQGEEEAYYRGTGGYEDGPHRGKGPQGYHGSDERIRFEVCERLTDHGWLDASGIEVSVSDSEVTLQGTVDSRESKRLADQLANTVTGVRDVHNRLTIAWGEEGQ